MTAKKSRKESAAARRVLEGLVDGPGVRAHPDLAALLRRGATRWADTGDAGLAALARILDERLDRELGERTRPRDEALAWLAASGEFDGERATSARALHRAVAEAIRNYERTGWRRDRGYGEPSTVGVRAAALFAIVSHGPCGVATVKAILAKPCDPTAFLAIFFRLQFSRPAPEPSPSNSRRRAPRMFAEAKPKPDTDILLAALARKPENQKLLADDRAAIVADRKARLARIKALDAKAEIDWPREQAAIAGAVAKVRAAERELRAANDGLNVVNAAAFEAQHARTVARRAEEAALLAGADVAAVEKFKGECLDELARLRGPGVLVSGETVERNPVTRETVRRLHGNGAAVKARLDAVLASYRGADELKLEPDQARLGEIVEAIKAAWPIVETPALPAGAAK
jgi:hypothetical protein